MLVEQAVLQVRVFTDADPDVPMPHEDAVRAAMRSAVGR
jgi:shikimate 5-dehydrogenase